MKKRYNVLIIAVILLLLATSLTGCGKDTSKTNDGSDGKQEAVTLKIYNWGDYIDEEVIDKFEEKTGIKVIYDIFTTNEDMYVKISSGGAEYDVLFPSDYMIKRMIDEDLLSKIDMSSIPNYKYIEDRFKNLNYDPNNEYSVPYMWGTVGILYNTTMVSDPVDSWNILWNEKYKGQILMQDSIRDCIGVALKKLGYSMNTSNEDELEAAKKELIAQKPLVMSYVVDEVKDKMIVGEAALAVVWSGDAIYCKSENEDLAYAIPKEGTNLWFDAMVIPKSSKHQKEAQMFIDFMCDPEIAFANADYIGYASPHSEAVKMLDPQLTSDRTAYPLAEDLKNSEIYEYNADTIKAYDRIWTEIKAR